MLYFSCLMLFNCVTYPTGSPAQLKQSVVRLQTETSKYKQFHYSWAPVPDPPGMQQKVAECGGQCTLNPRLGGVLMRVGKDAFEIEPLDLSNQCSPESVSAHMLYESSDPYRLTEPGGVLDVTKADYQWLNARVTRVTGSRWEPMPYTMKLEGARGGDFQTIMIIGIEDPGVLAHLSEFHVRCNKS
jgi:hypothetical protein